MKRVQNKAARYVTDKTDILAKDVFLFLSSFYDDVTGNDRTSIEKIIFYRNIDSNKDIFSTK